MSEEEARLTVKAKYPKAEAIPYYGARTAWWEIRDLFRFPGLLSNRHKTEAAAWIGAAKLLRKRETT